MCCLDRPHRSTAAKRAGPDPLFRQGCRLTPSMRFRMTASACPSLPPSSMVRASRLYTRRQLQPGQSTSSTSDMRLALPFVELHGSTAPHSTREAQGGWRCGTSTGNERNPGLAQSQQLAPPHTTTHLRRPSGVYRCGHSCAVAPAAMPKGAPASSSRRSAMCSAAPSWWLAAAYCRREMAAAVAERVSEPPASAARAI